MNNHLCLKGIKQSPINIKTSKTKSCGATCDLTFFYRTSACNLILSNRDVILDYDNGSYINYNHEIYELHKLSFTVPSSHNIDGQSFPMEVQLYHRSPNSGKMLIVAIFIEINDAISKSKMFFDRFSNSIPKKRGEQITLNTPESWNAFQTIPENKAFYIYEGSLPRKPCTEGVIWVIMEDTVNCSEYFYNMIKRRSRGNIRPIQSLNHREVYYNHNTSQKTNRNYGNKLRCYTEKEFRNSCKRLVGDKGVEKTKYWKMVILTVVTIIIVTFVLFILWLIEKGLLKNLKGVLMETLNKQSMINQ